MARDFINRIVENHVNKKPESRRWVLPVNTFNISLTLQGSDNSGVIAQQE